MIVLGKSTLATKGLSTLLGVDPKTYVHVRNKMKVIKREFAKHGSAEDRENLACLLNGTYQTPPDSKHLAADPCPMLPSVHAVHKSASEVQIAGLGIHHVLALRLYTTSTYRSINDPMRASPPQLPHPFAATLYYIAEAISMLREVQGKDPLLYNTEQIFWRGMKDLQVAEEFFEKGGAEMACMSTTSDPTVAAEFAEEAGSTGRVCPLLFKFVSKSFMSHGADISFLSVYPSEKEVLYPPLTYLRPIRRVQETIGGKAYDVVEVEPVFPK
jgi:hypothetical protein